MNLFENIIITKIYKPIAVFSEGDTVEALVEVTSSYPYKKTLSAKYTLSVDTVNFSYNIEDAPKNNFLTLFTHNYNILSTSF